MALLERLLGPEVQTRLVVGERLVLSCEVRLRRDLVVDQLGYQVGRQVAAQRAAGEPGRSRHASDSARASANRSMSAGGPSVARRQPARHGCENGPLTRKPRRSSAAASSDRIGARRDAEHLEVRRVAQRDEPERFEPLPQQRAPRVDLGDIVARHLGMGEQGAQREHRGPVDVVGGADLEQRADDLGCGAHHGGAQAGETPRLREGAQHHEMRVLSDQRQHRRAREREVGLVDHEQRPSRTRAHDQLREHVVGKHGAGRLVGVGEEHRAWPGSHRLQQRVVVHRKVVRERDLDGPGTEHPAVDRVHRVRRGEHDRAVAGSHVGMVQRAHGRVRAGREQQPRPRNPQPGGELVVELVGRWIAREQVRVDRRAQLRQDRLRQRRQPLVAIEADDTHPLAAALAQAFDRRERRDRVGQGRRRDGRHRRLQSMKRASA